MHSSRSTLAGMTVSASSKRGRREASYQVDQAWLKMGGWWRRREVWEVSEFQGEGASGTKKSCRRRSIILKTASGP